MNIDVRVPEMGESITEATIASWSKHPGDPVATGDLLLVLETEKAAMEIPAPAEGVLEEVVKEPGSKVRPGDLLGRIREGGAALARPKAQLQALEEAGEGRGLPRVEVPLPVPPSRPVSPPQTDQPAASAAQARPGAIAPDLNASPLARRIADAYGIDLGEVEASGPGGRVTREDVERYVQSKLRPPSSIQSTPERSVPSNQALDRQPPLVQPASARGPEALEVRTPKATDDNEREDRVRLSARKLTMARRMAEANRTAAMATTYNEVDLKEVMALRSRRREAFKKKHGTDLGFMPFFVKAAVEGLRAFPSLNAEFQEEDLVLKRYYDIGIAVGLEDGLVVPVLRDAASKSFAEIESVIADMVQKAKDKRLSLEDLRGGTFTITNGGVFGSMWSTPLLNPPQTGILGLHRIEDRPVVREGQIVVRPMMYLALTYDHRVVDGREAVLCLARMKEVLEDPAAGLLGL